MKIEAHKRFNEQIRKTDLSPAATDRTCLRVLGWLLFNNEDASCDDIIRASERLMNDAMNASEEGAYPRALTVLLKGFVPSRTYREAMERAREQGDAGPERAHGVLMSLLNCLLFARPSVTEEEVLDEVKRLKDLEVLQ